MLAAVSLALSTLVGFVLLVVTTCSVPVSHSIYLWSITYKRFQFAPIPVENGTQFPRPDGDVRGGILGFCATLVDWSANYRMSHDGDNSRSCSPTTLGYTFNLTGPDGYQEIVNSTLASAMVLTPLAAALAGIALVISLVATWKRDIKVIPQVAAGPALLAAIFSWVAFAVGYASAMQVKRKVEDDQDVIVSGGDSLEFSLGSAAFLPLGAALALTIGLLAWAYFYISARKKVSASSDVAEKGSRASSPTTAEGSEEAKQLA